jgi:peptidoglycan/xylan/chitin deacetylase (PgdA/CDA1 family)
MADIFEIIISRKIICFYFKITSHKLKVFRKDYIRYQIKNAEGRGVMIKYKKQLSVIIIIFLTLFTFAGCKSKEQIQLLSNKIVELEKSNEKLNFETAELKKANEKLNSEQVDLKKSNETLNSEIEELKLNNQKLIESNDTLQKENAALKKKLEAAEANKQTGIDKIAYLTFDDGPSDNTTKILDILKENNIKATFFVNGRSDRKETYERIVNEGHIIGNHTYSHDYAALYKTIDGFTYDMQKLDDFIYEITGIKPEILRFPGGSNNQVSYRYGGVDFMDKLTKHIKQSGIKYFDWNVDSTDASVGTQDKDKIISEVLKNAKNKNQAIILMHDSAPKITTALALPAIITGLKNQGFKFAALSPEVNVVQFK